MKLYFFKTLHLREICDFVIWGVGGWVGVSAGTGEGLWGGRGMLNSHPFYTGGVSGDHFITL